MPLTTRAAITAGRLGTTPQPRIMVDEELTLRPWRGSDGATLMAAYQDPEIQRWHARTLDDEDEAGELIARWQRAWVEETGAGWAVIDNDDVLMGRVALGSLNLHEAVAAVGYWTEPAARGRRVASRAVGAVARWATGTAGFHRLELEHSTRNDASCRVARNAGFRPEGVRASAALHADGWHDMHVHVRHHSAVLG